MADIVLKDRNGNSIEYPGVERIKVNTVDGGTVEFISNEGVVYENAVNFYDYDGTLIAAYSLEEAHELTALPDCPTHDGLISQGWNHSLENIQFTPVPIDVGAMYITDDGKTRFYITLRETDSLTVNIYFEQTVSGGTTFDWGDGNTSTISGTTGLVASHTYNHAGDYCITLTISEGLFKCGKESTTNYLFKDNKNALRKAHIGNNVEFGTTHYGFKNCYGLEEITIPKGTEYFSPGMFYDCYELKCVIVPNSVIDIKTEAFYRCVNVLVISIPDSAPLFYDNNFTLCCNLRKVFFPDKCTKIGYNNFRQVGAVKTVCLPSTITNVSSNAFSFGAVNLRIYVPDDTLNNFKTMTNLTNVADQIYPLSELSFN